MLAIVRSKTWIEWEIKSPLVLSWQSVGQHRHKPLLQMAYKPGESYKPQQFHEQIFSDWIFVRQVPTNHSAVVILGLESECLCLLGSSCLWMLCLPGLSVHKSCRWVKTQCLLDHHCQLSSNTKVVNLVNEWVCQLSCINFSMLSTRFQNLWGIGVNLSL